MDMLLRARAGDFVVASPLDLPYGAIWSRHRHFPLSHRSFNFFSLWGLYRFLRQNEVRIIHSHGFGAGVYSRLLRFLDLLFFRRQFKIAHTYHGLHFTTKSWFLKYLYYGIEKILMFLTDRFICVSEGEKQRLVQWGLYRPLKTKLISGSVFVHDDSAPFRDESYFQVLFVGRFDPVKNISLAYEIAKNMREENVVFVFVGGGELFEFFREKLKKDGLSHVFLEGEKDNVDEYLKRSHLFLNTSFVEGLSIGVLEAMERGLPILVSDVMGNREIVVEGENGYAVSLGAKGTKQWENHIKKLRDDRALREKMGFAAIERVRGKYAFSLMKIATEALYDELLD